MSEESQVFACRSSDLDAYDTLDAGLCIVCGENWCEDTRCDRCKRQMEEERLERDSGR